MKRSLTSVTSTLVIIALLLFRAGQVIAVLILEHAQQSRPAAAGADCWGAQC
jgi:hypothetical protein